MLSQALILTSRREYAQALRASLLSLGHARVDVELDALRAIQLVPKTYALIVLDLSMDAMDGLQLLLLLRQQAPASAFVVVGDADDETSRALAYQHGADLFLVRPGTPEAFQKAAVTVGAFLQPAAEEKSSADQEPLSRTADIVQTSCLSGDSVLLHVRSESQSGDIFIHAGEIFHAQYPGKSGIAAFHKIVHWDGGMARIGTLKIQHLPPRTIETPYRELLEKLDLVDALPGGDRLPLTTALSTLAGETAAGLPPDLLSEAPPRPEAESFLARASARETTGLPPIEAHWKVDLMGNLVENSPGSDPDHCALLTNFIYRKLADVAVALEVDYFTHLTLWGPRYQQVLAADNLGVRHALFEAARTDESQREQYLKWCREQSL
jgi:CheY-like chemotaxis protein